MLGTLGAQEMVFIFLLALLLFGPKELPRIGRTIGKALTEFRRASNELKDTFDREMKNLEAETGVKEVVNQYQYDTYNYDYSSYETNYEGSYGSESHDSTAASTPSIVSASAPQDAQSPSAVSPEGTVAHGSELAAVTGTNEHPHDVPSPNGHADQHSTAEHNA